MSWTGDTELRNLLKGPNIDRPDNLLSLSAVCHKAFRALYLGFDPIAGQSNTYNVVFRPPMGVKMVLPALPQTVTFTRADSDTTPLPDPNLLKYHCALVKTFGDVTRDDEFEKEWVEAPEWTRIRPEGLRYVPHRPKPPVLTQRARSFQIAETACQPFQTVCRSS